MADVSLIVATTLSDWAPEIADAVTDRNAFMAFMKTQDRASGGKGRKRFVVVDGGYDFRETVFFNVNSTFKGYNDRETIDTTVGNPVKEAQYAHKIVAGSVNISLDEEVSNTQKYQIHNLADTKREEAEISMAEVMGAAALSDGTTDTKIPGGLQQIISTTNNVVGAIDSSVNSGWRPQRDTSGVTAWNTSSEGLIQLDALYENCTRATEHPDAIVTTVAVKSLINIMLINRLTINIEMNKDMAKLGYDTVRYRGAEVMADDNVPAQTLYLVNTKYTRFQVMRGANFDLTPMKSPIGGLFKVMQLYMVGNFTCGARRLNGLMTAIAG